ncbi:MAG TPA: hypothetical protein VF048_13985 [Gemmatimonadaceae bacterium]|jgi:hypothetical protein
MRFNRLLRKRRHPAAAFVSDHGMLLTGIAGSAVLAYAANRMRGKDRPQFVDRAVDKSRELGNRARGFMSRSHDHAADTRHAAEEPAISRANGSRNRVELSAP